MKEEIRHISNRKYPGCDVIPIEFIKAGGDEAIRVMTSLCNRIWKIQIWQMTARNQYMFLFTKRAIKECGN